MIKVLHLIPKRPDISDEQFRRYWREVRAPLAFKFPGLRPNARRLFHAVSWTLRFA